MISSVAHRVTHNGSGLADVADLNAQNCQAAPKIINSTHFKLPLHPQYSASPCYANTATVQCFAVSSFPKVNFVCVSNGFNLFSASVIYS